MLRWILRAAFLRFLPRRLLPILSIVELLLLVRALRARRSVRVDEPTASLTAPPPRIPSSSGKS